MLKERIFQKMRNAGHGSPVYLQKKMKISFQQAKEICGELDYKKVPIENLCSSKHKLK